MNAAKKDFTNIATGNVYSTIAEATAEAETQEVLEAETESSEPIVHEVHEEHTERVKRNKFRKTYTPEEKAQFLSDLKSRGRKDVRLPRINMAFSPENYEYIRTMAQVTGLNLTQFVNNLIKQHREEYHAEYEKAIQFRDLMDFMND